MILTSAPPGLREGVKGPPERWFLVVEDNADDEMLARRAYSQTGRREKLVVAHHGEEALKLLHGQRAPALVLMDLKLPRLSGVDVLIAMKDDSTLKTVPVVIFTSSNSLTDLAACYELGCNAFVQKPIEFDRFISTYQKTLEFWLSANMSFNELLR